MEQIILEYFNKNNNRTLSVLDNKYRKHYTGVTLNYITYNLLKAKYKKYEVARILRELFKSNKIRSLFCNDIKQYVFENTKSNHWSFSVITGTHWSSSMGNKNIYEYLKQFTKDE